MTAEEFRAVLDRIKAEVDYGASGSVLRASAAIASIQGIVEEARAKLDAAPRRTAEMMDDREWLKAAFSWVRSHAEFKDWRWLHDNTPQFLEQGPVVDLDPLQVWGKRKRRILYVRHSWDGGSAELQISIPKDLTP